ncbi:MAG: hypothetical protein FWD77_07290 [Betaproteobacteria bacterium]|nr:hypothetical protein [Betaproteobacteria bacterium]
MLAPPDRGRGAVLIIALVGMAAMSIATAYLARSATVTNQVAGNISMRQSVKRVSAIGFEMALERLADRATNPAAIGLEGAWKFNPADPLGAGCAIAGEQCWYYPRELFAQSAHTANNPLLTGCNNAAARKEGSLIPAGVPVCIPEQPGVTKARAIDWFSDTDFVPMTRRANNNIPKGYRLRYLIDRQCAAQSINNVDWNPGDSFTDSTPPKSDKPAAVRKFCRTREGQAGFGNLGEWKKQQADRHNFSTDAGAATISLPRTYFRITVQVIGPRSTVHFAQALVLI